MSKSLLRSASITRYVNDTIICQTPVQLRLRQETAQMPEAVMQITPDQGAFLSFLVGLIGARKAIEIGTFTGYSALCIAGAMGPAGRLIACDISEEWTTIARKYWKEAALADRIDLRLAPALKTLDTLLANGGGGTFDFAFIDADKPAYESYYTHVLPLLRPGGLIVMDNSLGDSDHFDQMDYDPAKCPMHSLNLKIRDDHRVEAMIVTVGAGMMVARKR